MGAGFSRSNSVWLQTDKPLYHDGEIVQGLVCLNILKPVTITSVECQLQGVERTYWTETRDSGTGSHRTSHTEHHGTTVQLLNVTNRLSGAGREYPPGQYQWNVVFGLPQGLPSSFKIGSGTEGAEVSYIVNLVFHTPGMFSSAIRASQQLTVHQRLALPPVTVDQSVDKQLTSCCCFGQGSLQAHVRLDRDRAQPGEEVQLILEVDNRSKQVVRRIDVCLKQEAEALERVGGGGGRRRWHRELAKGEHPGIQPFTTLQGGLARRMALRLPEALPPSMRGSVITCNHYVKLKIRFKGCVRAVEMKVPLIVTAPQPVATADEPFYTEPPAFWSPAEVAPVQAIDVPSAPPLPPELLKPDAPFWARSLSKGSTDQLTTPLLGPDTTNYSVV